MSYVFLEIGDQGGWNRDLKGTLWDVLCRTCGVALVLCDVKKLETKSVTAV